MASSVSNADIMRAVGRLEGKVDDLTAQAMKTNGRVTTIEEWKNALQAVEAYKDKNQGFVGKAETVVIQQKWFQNDKLVGGVVAVLLALSAAIGFIVRGA